MTALPVPETDMGKAVFVMLYSPSLSPPDGPDGAG